MNKLEDFNHSKIIKIEPYQNDDGRWLFNLTYELWDGNGNVAELNIPCVENPFSNCSDSIRLSEQIDEQRAWDESGNVISRYDKKYYKADIKTLENVDIYAVDNCFFTIKMVKRVMTIDDIEKELGYEVKIVNGEKGEFYDC
jgi:hypothetical protein